MDTQQLLDLATRIQSDSEAIIAALKTSTPPSDQVVVKAGDDLQAALDKGGVVNVADGTTFNSNYVMRVAGTQLIAPNASIVGKAGAPALDFKGTGYTAIVGSATTAWDQSVIQVGDNSLTRLEDLPTDIFLTINVPTFRGKHAFNINGQRVTLKDCSVRDCWDPALRDSQAVGILNTPGDITVDGGYFEAGSENFFIGGSATGIPNVVPTNISVSNLTLSKPLSWFTDGTKRVVKNLFELKSGVNVKVKNVKMSGCWPDGQAGWAIMLTPRDGKQIANVSFEDIDISNVGNGISILGFDDSAPSPELHDLSLVRVSVVTDRTYGTGRFIQAASELHNLTVDTCKFTGTGTTFYYNTGTAWDSTGKKITLGQAFGVKFVNNILDMAGYGIMTGGYGYGQNWQQSLPDGIIDNNTFTNVTSSWHKKYLPTTNIFLPPAA